MVPTLSTPLRMHVLGVGGAAMSRVAAIARQQGHTVTGSDQVASAALPRLRAAGCDVWAPHDPHRLSADIDVVAISRAVPEDNAELVALRRRGVPVASRADVMEALGSRKRTVAVSGTAGKTTTAAMMATIADAAGWRPSLLVGSSIPGLGPGAAWTDSEWFVVEADESDGSFLRFRAEAALVTNIAVDHLDYWGTIDRLRQGFLQFIGQARGPKVLNADDPGSAALIAQVHGLPGVVTVGFHAAADYRIEDFAVQRLTSRFALRRLGRHVADVALTVPGRHNATNAAAALAMAVELGVAPAHAASALQRFQGTARRFQFRGRARGVDFVDDYAHLPMKVSAAIAAAAQGGWSRIVAVYQPCRYTRIRDTWSAHADSFTGADLAVVTDIYEPGREVLAGISGRLIVDAVRSAHPEQDIVYCPRAALIELLEVELRPGDLCLTMSIGDLTTLPDEMLGRPWAHR